MLRGGAAGMPCSFYGKSNVGFVRFFVALLKVSEQAGLTFFRMRQYFASVKLPITEDLRRTVRGHSGVFCPC